MKRTHIIRIFNVRGTRQVMVTIVAMFLFVNFAGSLFAQVPLTGHASAEGVNDHYPLESTSFIPSASLGTPARVGEYIILRYTGQSTPSRATSLESLMVSWGMITTTYDVTDVMGNPEVLRDAPAIIIDGSVGSDQGIAIPRSVIIALIQADRPVILLGNASWLVPALSGHKGPPIKTAPVTTQFFPDHGAVYSVYPNNITDGATLTSESLTLPINPVQTEYSRLVNLTSSSNPSVLPVLQYLSYRLDTFIVGLGDPLLWTTDGEMLLENIIAYATTLSESPTSVAIGDTQYYDTVSGGLAYGHVPEVKNTYYAVHMAYDLLSPSEFSTWALQRESVVFSILSDLYVDEGSVSGFKKNRYATGTDLVSTAQGLWVMETMGLASYFVEAEVISYLSNAQDADGGFANDVTTTYLVTEALAVSGSLSTVNTANLIFWLHECQVKSADSGDIATWGGFGKNPTDGNPSSLYTFQGLLALQFLNEGHDDLKTVEWLWNRMNGDGSFDNTISDGSDLIVGTASAIGALELFSVLDTGNKSQSLGWLANKQLPSGGFGNNDADIVGRTKDTAYVALSLAVLGESANPIASSIMSFINTIEHEAGFDGMRIIPSLMWGYYLGTAARYSHASGSVNMTDLERYLLRLTDMSIYPPWSNISAYITPEYSINQYWMKSVWTYLFGVGMANITGVQLTSTDYIATYLVQQQDSSGHFKPYIYPSTPHMQYSVAAVEALYLLDALDLMSYRAQLESAVLAEYAAGSWSGIGWTLEPLAGNQPVIDWLSTRAAARLGILNTTMAAEIASSVIGRLQYTDLWALSRDVASLSLLDSIFSSDYLGYVNKSQVLDALRSSSLRTTGWYNTTSVWQPLFTSGVLEMVSQLGLRTNLTDAFGSRITATLASPPIVGNNLDIDVNIESSQNNHSIYVYAFGTWTLFENVTNTDTLILTVPADASMLGPQDISIMLWDTGQSRAYGLVPTTVSSSLTGSMVLDETMLLMGDNVNGTVTWFLQDSIDAGLTNITVKLGDPPTYKQWYYTDVSPFSFSVPTTDFGAGTYNLTVTLEKDYCATLVLQQEVIIDVPVEVYFQTNATLSGHVLEQSTIPFDLLFVGNDSQAVGQSVTLIITDEYSTVVYTDSMVSTPGTDNFLWTPSQRGNYTFTLSTERNGTIEATQTSGFIEISEDSALTWYNDGTHEQYSNVTLTAYLSGETGGSLAGRSVRVIIMSPSSSTVIDTVLTTNSTGHVSIDLYLAENGFYTLRCEYAGEYLISPTFSLSTINSFSNTSITLSGVAPEGLVNQTWEIAAELVDSQGLPLFGKNVTITITYLPSTTVYQATLTTNATGHVSLQWTFPAHGAYSVKAVFAGTASLLASNVTALSDLYTPSSPSITATSSFEVGILGWIQVLVEDHDANSLNGVNLSFVVRDPLDTVIYSATGTTVNGLYNFTFLPTMRGVNSYEVSIDRQGWIEGSFIAGTIRVYEQVQVVLQLDAPPIAVGSGTLTITVLDSSGNPIPSLTLTTVSTLDGTMILNVTAITDGNGQVTLLLNYNAIGALYIAVDIPQQSWLYESHVSDGWTVLGQTTLGIPHNGLPIDQGTTIGYTVTLSDWMDNPLAGGDITITIEFSNGTLLRTIARVTGTDGTCAFGQTYDLVGDFVVRASYSGTGLNASSESFIIQRVTVTPDLVLLSDPTVQLGDTAEFLVALKDNYGAFIAGRSITLSVSMDGITIYETVTLSESQTIAIHWTPTARGLATVTLLHQGDVYYLENSTYKTISVMEVATGEVVFENDVIDLFDSVVINYTLTCNDALNVTIDFTILDADMFPIWTQTVVTDANGLATVNYIADDAYGVLSVLVAPSIDQFLMGADIQALFTVKTTGTPDVILEPYPAIVLKPVNITVSVTDQLGGGIDGITVSVSAYFQGQKVDLGGFAGTARVDIIDGIGIVTFVPERAGAYSFSVSYSGGKIVYSFDASGFVRNVHSPTYLTFVLLTSDLETGNTLNATVKLTDYEGNPMSFMTVHLTLEGVESTDFLTDENGEVFYSSLMASEGTKTLTVSFDGYTVYLASSNATEIQVRTGTSITALVTSNWVPIAASLPVTISVLLEDDSGTPLEGRTVTMMVYHNGTDLLWTDNIIAFGQDPEILNVTLPLMGNYTLILAFAGTDSYYPSSSAIDIFVIGTSNIELEFPNDMDRSDNVTGIITFLDEISSPLVVEGLDIEISLTGTNLDSRLVFDEQSIQLRLMGLEVGNYTLDVVLHESAVRLGSSMSFEFTVYANSTLSVSNETLSGITYEEHWVELLLVDSLGETIEDATLFISLWDPDGKEIYGNIVTSVTKVHSDDGLVLITWVPSKAGNYTLKARYDGTEFTKGTEFVLTSYARHATIMDASGPGSIQFPDIPTISISLQSGNKKIANAPITVRLVLGNSSVTSYLVTTDIWGRASCQLADIVAGNLTVVIEYAGNDQYMPSERIVSIIVSPEVDVDISTTGNHFLGGNITIHISVDLLGVQDTFEGKAVVEISPQFEGGEAVLKTRQIGSQESWDMQFIPYAEGEYVITVKLSGIPVIGSFYKNFTLTITQPVLQIEMEPSTTPVIGSGVALSILGIALRKRLHGAVDTIVGEWDS